MNQETKDKILQEAENHLPFYTKNTMYGKALNAGVVSRENLIFLGVVDELQGKTLESLIEMGSAPVHVEDTAEGKVPFIVQDDPDFVERRDRVVYALIGEMYGCSSDEAQERFYDIYRKVTEHHNTTLKKNSDN